jgi:hypothetical protein
MHVLRFCVFRYAAKYVATESVNPCEVVRPMSSPSPHSAVGPALGYYYQAIYALRLLLLEDDPVACIAIESWDDVVLEKGVARELHQLKHTIDLAKTIGIKSPALWRTLTVWLDYSSSQDASYSHFFLATVASLQSGSELECLRLPGSDRKALVQALEDEAQRVIDARKQAELDKLPKDKWPYADRWKDCNQFINTPLSKRTALLNRAALLPESFSISSAQIEISKILGRMFPSRILPELTKQLLAWWDREVLETLTGERASPLFVDEVRAFITKRAALLYQNGFFEDTSTYRLIISPNAPAINAQLDMIEASVSQRQRATEMELRARAQRAAWMKADVTKTQAIKQYDAFLVEEWSYRFDIRCDESKDKDEKTKQKHGRDLLNWSHLDAPNEVRRIDQEYHNPDLVRGSYIYLSGNGAVGWHPQYVELLKQTKGKGKK